MEKYTKLVFNAWQSWRVSATGCKCHECGARLDFGDDWYTAEVDSSKVYLCCTCARKV